MSPIELMPLKGLEELHFIHWSWSQKKTKNYANEKSQPPFGTLASTLPSVRQLSTVNKDHETLERQLFCQGKSRPESSGSIIQGDPKRIWIVISLWCSWEVQQIIWPNDFFSRKRDVLNDMMLMSQKDQVKNSALHAMQGHCRVCQNAWTGL